MKLLKFLKKWTSFYGVIIIICVGTLTYGFVLAWNTIINDYTSSLASMEQRVLTAETRLQENQRILDLAIEFGFDPIIIDVTRHFSRQTIESADLTQITWRYINTPEELTHIMLSIISIESGGDIAASGDSGRAYGLTQMWLTTAQMYDADITGNDLLSVERHLDVAFRHFVDLLETNHGNMTFAALAWNRGQGAVSRAIARGEMPMNGYVKFLFDTAAMRNAAMGD